MGIKAKDILQFLDGNSSSETIKDLQEWAYDDLSNAQDLAIYQSIYNELPGLKDYKKVDVEWKDIVGETNTIDKVSKAKATSEIQSISDEEMWRYLEGKSDHNNQEKIESWAIQSVDNQRELAQMETISKESEHLADYRMVSVDEEWNVFNKSLKGAETPVITLNSTPQQEKDNERRLLPIWVRYVAAAAAILLLGLFVSKNLNSTSGFETKTFATSDVPDNIEISDGTIIRLGENSEVTYFADYNKVQERRVDLTGQAEFEVVNVENRPFEVIASDQIGVKVLGTTFSVGDSDDYIKVVKNIEGKVKVYALHDTSVNVIAYPGESYGYTGTEFIKIEEEKGNAKNYDVLYVLDYLMEASGWKVISSPYTEFDGEDVILIDLDQPYEEILEDLVKHADFSFEKLSCEGCYRVNRFQGQ